MTIIYNIAQCKREFEAYSTMLYNPFLASIIKGKGGYSEYIIQMKRKWANRLIEAQSIAIETNRAIIEHYDTDALVQVVRTQFNPYMAIAALRLLAEDPEGMTYEQLEDAATYGRSLANHHNIAVELHTLADALDELRALDPCPGCRYGSCDDAACGEAPSDYWRQADHL